MAEERDRPALLEEDPVPELLIDEKPIDFDEQLLELGTGELYLVHGPGSTLNARAVIESAYFHGDHAPFVIDAVPNSVDDPVPDAT